MKIVMKPAEEVFHGLRGHAIGKLEIPTGKYDPKSTVDKRLKSKVPKADKTYKFPGSVLQPVLIAMHLRHNILLVGATGVGKTMLAMMLAHHCRLPLTRTNFDEDMGRPEFVGYYGIPAGEKDDGYKEPGLVKALRHPGIQLWDEWDAKRAGVAMALQPVLEDYDPGLYLVEKDEFVRKNADCIIIGTANTRGLGDDTGLYAGTSHQNFAQLNRFHLVEEVPPLAPSHVDAILKAQRPGGRPMREEVRTAVVQLYQMCLDSWQSNDISMPLSPRMAVHLAEYHPYLGPQAIQRIILSKLPTEVDRSVVLELAQRVKLVEAA